MIGVLRLGLRASKVPVLFFENKFFNFLDELVSSVVSTFPVENPNPAACFAAQRTFSPRLAGSRGHSPQGVLLEFFSRLEKICSKAKWIPACQGIKRVRTFCDFRMSDKMHRMD